MEKVLEFIQKEKDILDFWQKNKIFEKSIELLKISWSSD